jgi:hypothetical protein
MIMLQIGSVSATKIAQQKIGTQNGGKGGHVVLMSSAAGKQKGQNVASFASLMAFVPVKGKGIQCHGIYILHSKLSVGRDGVCKKREERGERYGDEGEKERERDKKIERRERERRKKKQSQKDRQTERKRVRACKCVLYCYHRHITLGWGRNIRGHQTRDRRLCEELRGEFIGFRGLFHQRV